MGSFKPTLLLLPILPLLLWKPGKAFAAKQEPADAPPRLISTQGGEPKWRNLAQLQKSAEQGDPQACFELGARLMEGNGLERNLARAQKLLEQAAQGGVADAWFKLGKIAHDGLNGAPDYGRALDYFTHAAQAGIAEAQYNLGAMLVSARGVKRDYIEGLAWLIVATKSGAESKAEEQVRARLASRPADIQAAENRAAQLIKDLSHATVRAMLTGISATAAPTAPPKIDMPALSAAPPVRPVITGPKIDAPKPPEITAPLLPGSTSATPEQH